MSRTFPNLIARRRLLGAVFMALTPAAAWAQPRRKVVTILGDSITAGLGLPAKSALPFQLESALTRAGQAARVRGAGVSGDTTALGLARIDFSVQKDTDVCVVALGGNDMLQGIDPKRIRANLEKIVRRLKARGITVVMAGLKAPRVIGAGYARDYEAAFAAVAKEQGVIFLPDLLGPVALDERLNQRDGIHPTADGVKILVSRLTPLVVRALNTRK